MSDDIFIDESLIERDDPAQVAMAPRPLNSRRPALPPALSGMPVPTNRDAAFGAESIRRARREGLHLSTFPLTRTGGYARVKRPSMLALRQEESLPNHIRPIIDSIITRQIREPSEEAKEQMEKFDATNAIELIDVTVIAGFVDPIVVPTDHMKSPEGKVYRWPGATLFAQYEDEGYVRCRSNGDEYDDKVFYVDEIDIDDRAEFFAWCNESTRTEAAAVAPFPQVPPPPAPAS